MSERRIKRIGALEDKIYCVERKLFMVNSKLSQVFSCAIWRRHGLELTLHELLTRPAILLVGTKVEVIDSEKYRLAGKPETYLQDLLSRKVELMRRIDYRVTRLELLQSSLTQRKLSNLHYEIAKYFSCAKWKRYGLELSLHELLTRPAILLVDTKVEVIDSEKYRLAGKPETYLQDLFTDWLESQKHTWKTYCRVNSN